MAEKLADYFPQLADIKSKDLRDAVEKCWMTAIERGGWQLADLDVIPFTMLSDLKEISLGAHTRNVTNCAIAVAKVMSQTGIKAYDIDFDLLIAGGLLHDVGKVLEYGRKDGEWFVTRLGKILRHPISGCALAAELGLPEDVQHIIAVHSHEGDRSMRTTEAWIVHHSDFINFDPIKR